MIKLSPTPLQEYPSLAKAVGVAKLYIKREDLNPSGSHKDRGLWPYLDTLIAQGEKEFCLSSSGNLGISAACYAKTHGDTTFHLFLPATISMSKLNRLAGCAIQGKRKNQISLNNTIVLFREKLLGVNLYFSHAPKKEAFQFAREKKIQLLRGSTDNGLLEGYQQLAKELIEQIPPLVPPLLRGGWGGGSIFMAVSSGTMTVGLWEGFEQYCHPGAQRSGAIGSPGDSIVPTSSGLQNDSRDLPQLHIVQTTKVHPIASAFDHDFTLTKTSLASAIVDRVAHRKAQIIQAVKESGGWGWVVGDEEIEEARRLIREHCRGVGIQRPYEREISPESAMSLAGLKKALGNGFAAREPVVLVFTGK